MNCFSSIKPLPSFILGEQKGHGIPDTLLNEVKDVTRRFFQLPYEEKIKIKMTAATGFRFSWLYIKFRFCHIRTIHKFFVNSILISECRGYQRVGENITKGVPDMHEAIDVGFSCCFTLILYIQTHTHMFLLSCY